MTKTTKNKRKLLYSSVELTEGMGFIQSTVPEDMKKKILDSLAEGKDSWSAHLAGQIKKQIRLYDLQTDFQFVNYLKNLVAAYNIEFTDVDPTQKIHEKLFMDSVWANYQEKYEFNPPHTHDGLYSFVVWVKVPYYMTDEHKSFPSAKEKHSGTFNFIYNDDNLVEYYTINADKTYEWEIVLFPSWRMHSVHPFYSSNDVRISVSGNLVTD